MENIIEKICEKKATTLAESINDYAGKVFKTPRWVVKSKRLTGIYAKIRRFEIKEYKFSDTKRRIYDFLIAGRKVGELRTCGNCGLAMRLDGYGVPMQGWTCDGCGYRYDIGGEEYLKGKKIKT